MDAAQSLFRLDVGSPLEMSLVEGTRRQHGLTINNSPNSELEGSGYTGPLLEVCLLEEGGSGICGAAVDVGRTCSTWKLSQDCTLK